MSWVITMRCPVCGADRSHPILQEWVDEDGFVVAYDVVCMACEHRWKERLR